MRGTADDTSNLNNESDMTDSIKVAGLGNAPKELAKTRKSCIKLPERDVSDRN